MTLLYSHPLPSDPPLPPFHTVSMGPWNMATLSPLCLSGRLPDADKGTIGGTIQHIRDIFGRMGFTDREMVALIGAHAVGRCHTEASGKLFQEAITRDQ